MMCDENNIKNEQQGQAEQDGDTSPAVPATFKGRLDLRDYFFPDPDASPRRSMRLSGHTPSPTPTLPGSSKRKPVAQVSSPSPKRKRQSSSYAAPSTYAHLPLLPDAMANNLLVMFVGLNPGIQTARTGHAYAHPSNLFWKLLFSSGITPRPCAASEDQDMPELYNLGLTNIVARPSRNGAELSKQEMDDGVALLEEKARKWRPESMCIVGKSIWESIWRVRHNGKAVGKNFRYGWQDETENMGIIKGEWKGAPVFVATSTSGLAATMSRAEKEEIWNQLGAFVMKRRAERIGQAEFNGED